MAKRDRPEISTSDVLEVWRSKVNTDDSADISNHEFTTTYDPIYQMMVKRLKGDPAPTLQELKFRSINKFLLFKRQLLWFASALEEDMANFVKESKGVAPPMKRLNKLKAVREQLDSMVIRMVEAETNGFQYMLTIMRSPESILFYLYGDLLQNEPFYVRYLIYLSGWREVDEDGDLSFPGLPEQILLPFHK